MNSAALVLASMDELVGWLWRANWQAAVLAALVLLVVVLAGRRMAPAWRYALWLLVVVRLCLPMLPSSGVSVFNLMRGSGGAGVMSAPRPIDGSLFNVSVEYGPASGHAAELPGVAPTQTSWFALHWRAVLIGLWLTGVAVLAAVVVVSHWRLARRIGRSSECIDEPEMIELVDRCRRELGMRHAVEVRISEAIGCPALFGVWRPVVLLPRDMFGFDRDLLRFVLLHELAHVKRRDVPANWLLTAVAVVHWFSPLVHYVVARCRQERELICDQMVLGVVGQRQRHAYGRALIELFERLVGEPSPALAVGLFGGRSLIARRIEMISRTSSSRQRSSIVAAVIFTALAGATLTDARLAPPADEPIIVPGLEAVQDPAKVTDAVTAIYDIRDLLDAARQRQSPLAPLPLLSKLFHGQAKYIVSEGDTLVSLAGVFLGDERDWEVIAKLNGLKSSDSLKPGQVLTLPGAQVEGRGASAEPASGGVIVDRLISDLRQWLASADEPSSIRTLAIDPRSGTLVASMSPPAHQRLAELLTNLRDSDKAMVDVQARFITGLESVVGTGNVSIKLPPEQVGGRAAVVVLTADDIDVIAEAGQGDASFMASPRVLVVSGQSASISMMSTAEVAVPDADGQGGQRTIKVDEGISLSVQADVSEDRRHVALHLHPNWSSLDLSKPLPILQQAEASITITVPDGGAVLLRLKGASLALIAAQRAQGEAAGDDAVPVLTREGAAEPQPLFVLVTARVIVKQKSDPRQAPAVPDR